MPSDTRQDLFVEPRLQGALLVRVALYWCLGAALIAVTLTLSQQATGSHSEAAAAIDESRGQLAEGNAVRLGDIDTLASIGSHVDSGWRGGRAGPVWRLALAAAVALAVLPLVLVDAARFSARFCGPLARVKGNLRQLATGRSVEPIVARKGDYWQSLIEEVNRLSARLETAGTSADADADDAVANRQRGDQQLIEW